jgi:hypothetical protein
MAELWTKAEKDYFAKLDKLKKLFRGEHETYFVLPNGEERKFEYLTINWLGDTITRSWRDYTFRESPTIIVPESVKELVEKFDLPTMYLPADSRKSYAGKAVVKGFYSALSKKGCTKVYGATDGEYVNFEYLDTDKSMPYAVNYWYVKYIPVGTFRDKLTDIQVTSSSSSEYKSVMVRERLELQVDSELNVTGVKLTNKAFECVGGVPTTKEVPWNVVWPEEDIRPEEEEYFEGMPFLPVAVNNNIDKEGDGEGDSDYTDSLISIQKNINKLAAVRQLVIDISEHPQLMIPPEYFDADGNVDWNKVRLRVNYDGEDGQEIKIVGWTGNLENSSRQWELYREELYNLTGLTPSGQLDSEARSGLARRLGLVSTEAGISARRHQWTKAIKQTIRMLIMLESQFGPKSYIIPEESEIMVIWPAAIPEETAEVTAMIIQEVQSGIRSLELAVKMLPRNKNLTEKEIEEEIQRIKDQKEHDIELDLQGGDLSGRVPPSSKKPGNEPS